MVMRFSELGLSLASLDVYKPDFELQVNAMDRDRRYFFFTESPVKQLALSPVIDARIPAMWMEKPSTQCAAG